MHPARHQVACLVSNSSSLIADALAKAVDTDAVRQVVLERVSPMINQLRASSEPPSKERFVQVDRSLRSALIQEADEAIWAADQVPGRDPQA